MDRGDFAAAVDRHYPGLLQRLTLVLHDAEEAKDVAQEAYLRAFQAWSRRQQGHCHAVVFNAVADGEPSA